MISRQKLLIRGHQRSGNHYLAALIEANLFNSTDYQRHMDPAGHLLPAQLQMLDLNIIHIFIYRNYWDTLKSIYNMRERFGLSGSWLDFQVKKIGELFHPGREACLITIKWHFKPEQRSTQVSGYFNEFPQHTLSQWWGMFCSKWVAEADRPNVYACRYEDLITAHGREQILGDIGKLINRPLGSPIRNITSRVGYYQTGREATWEPRRKDTPK